MESRTIPPPQASARQTEMGETFNRVLFSALDALQQSAIPYALIGGIAASGMGRPRSTHDIDIFVRPEDAEAALEALGTAGFETERTDLRWLFKGWREEMMVDIIFKSQGDIYFDTEMHQNTRLIHYHGRDIPAVSPEDLIIIKAAVHSEVGPHHWADALAILSHAMVDWDYLIRRARRAPRRLLALLIYAQSNDIWIPNQVINELYSVIFSEQSQSSTRKMFSNISGAAMDKRSTTSGPEKSAQPEAYLIGHIQDRLVTDSRTAATDVQLTIGGKKILIKGEASTPDQCKAIEEVVRDVASGFEIDNQVRVTEVTAPEMQEMV